MLLTALEAGGEVGISIDGHVGFGDITSHAKAYQLW